MHRNVILLISIYVHLLVLELLAGQKNKKKLLELLVKDKSVQNNIDSTFGFYALAVPEGPACVTSVQLKYGAFCQLMAKKYIYIKKNIILWYFFLKKFLFYGN